MLKLGATFLITVALLFNGIAVANHKGGENRHVEKSWIVKPPNKVKKKKKFTPTSTPSKSEVIKIANHEQKKWGGPSILRRVYCESKYYYGATNGQYRGLLQIGSIWGYLWSGTPRGVTIKDRKKIKKPVWRYRLWSDGTQGRQRIRYKSVKKVITKKGKLPSSSNPYHGWAALRVGQRAVAGYKTTGWSCSI